ncbi:MAG: hypothetical protein ACXW00_00300 [Methylobacter sp.]
MSAAGILTSVEYLVALSRGGFGASSLFAWQICRSRPGALFQGPLGRALDVLFSTNVFALFMLNRLVASGLLLVMEERCLLAGLLFYLAATTTLLNARHAHGHDGADQMLLILTVGTLAYAVFPVTSPWRMAGLLFIGTQSILSYVVSGSSKMTSSIWRSGRGLPGVLSTAIYGKPAVGAMLQSCPRLCFAMAWGLMIWQISTPIMAIAGSPWIWLWITGGIAFHTSAAVLMGLNSFLITFLGAYPCVLITAQLIRGAL